MLAVPVTAWAADLKAPYGPPQHQWAKTSGDWSWGSTAGLERGPHGEIWAIDRCGANTCDGSDRAPIVQLDTATAKPVRAIGAGLFVFPHGLHVDKSGNVWVTDGAISKDGSKGLQVIKLSPAGKVLLRLGTAGQRGDDATHFNSPSDVITAPNGDIFVTDGHAPIKPFIPENLDMRVMKFSPTGKFIKQWGKPGSGKSEFNNPHALAFDARGRLFVADRANNRVRMVDNPEPPNVVPEGSAQCARVAARPAPSGPKGTVVLSAEQLLINQRISQAAVRRVNAVQKWLDDRLATNDLCGGAFVSQSFDTGITTGANSAPRPEALTPADPRPVVAKPGRTGSGAAVKLEASQLLISQRISQAAVRRANELIARIEDGLLATDIRDAGLTSLDLAPGVAP